MMGEWVGVGGLAGAWTVVKMAFPPLLASEWLMVEGVGTRKMPTKLQKRSRWTINASGWRFQAADVSYRVLMVWKQGNLCALIQWQDLETCRDKQYSSCPCILWVQARQLQKPSFLLSIHSFTPLGSLRVGVMLFTLNKNLIGLNPVMKPTCQFETQHKLLYSLLISSLHELRVTGVNWNLSQLSLG